MSYEVESNNEKIEVEIVETEKGIVVNIKGYTQDVVVNGEIIYSNYDNEHYKFVPVLIRPFIEKHLESFGTDLNKEVTELEIYLCINNREFLCLLPINRAKSDYMLLRDWLLDYSLMDLNDELKFKAEAMYKELLKDISDYGYTFEMSHGGNDFDTWYELIIPIADFNEEKVLECLTLWDDYNSELYQICDM